MLYGLDRLITELTKINCYVSEDSISCVAMGTGIALEEMDVYANQATVYEYRRGEYFRDMR